MTLALISTSTEINELNLKELYLDKKLSVRRVGEHLGCDPNTAKKYLLLFGIPLRTRSEAYACRLLTRAGGRTRHAKRDFDGTPAQKAYLIGFRLGDLSVYPASSGPFNRMLEVRGRTTQQAQIKLFRELFEPYGHVAQSHPDSNGGVHLIGYLNRSFDFLLPKQDLVEPWIQANASCAAAFAAGYIDAEGSFYVTRTQTRLRVGAFAVASQDYHILTWMHQWACSLGISCRPPKLAIRRGTPRQFSLNKDYWIFQIARKESLVRLVNILTPWLRHPKRTADMQAVLTNIRERNDHLNLKYAYRAHRQWASAVTI